MQTLLTGAPVKGVNVCLALDNGMMKASASKIKTLPAGMYNVIIKKNGYAEQVMQIAVSEGEMTDLKIQISKN